MPARPLILFEIDDVLVERGGSSRLPGAAETLARLRHGGDAVLSLRTADDEATARARTTATGVDRYLDLDVAAYASAPVEQARRRAEERYGDTFTVVVVTTAAGSEVAGSDVVVGDLAELVQQFPAA